MQYEFNFSPDVPTTPYNTEGGLDSSTYSVDGKLVSAQRTGFVEVDSGKVDLVRDGEVVELPQEVVERLEKPQPISTTLYYTQSSVWSTFFFDEDSGQSFRYNVLVPADARNMTNGDYNENYATGTNGGDFEWVQADLNGVFEIKGVVVGCNWTTNDSDLYYDEDFKKVVSEDPSLPGLLGNWDKGYTENLDVQGSLDGVNWETLFNTGTFEKPIQTYHVRARVRYLRIVSVDDLAVTEFYAI